MFWEESEKVCKCVKQGCAKLVNVGGWLRCEIEVVVGWMVEKERGFLYQPKRGFTVVLCFDCNCISR